jgi:hypothetical protein
MNQKDRIAQALMAAGEPVAPVAQQPDPFVLNQFLEQRAQPESPPISPIVNAIMQKMGLLNMVRNRRNQALGDLTQTMPE